jgi:hypothetical protein
VDDNKIILRERGFDVKHWVPQNIRKFLKSCETRNFSRRGHPMEPVL